MVRLNHKIKYTFLSFLSLIFILVWSAVFSQASPDELEIIFFDVGQGDAIFIETPNGNQVLIDGGPDTSVLAKLGKELPFYDRTIDLIILTHPDEDHLAGLVEVLKRYQVDQILTTGILCQTAVCQKWTELIKEKDIPIKIAQAGQIIDLGSEIAMIVLYPFENLSGQEVKKKNNTSIITRLVYGQNSFLFAGDAERLVERRLLEQNIYLDSDVLKVGHHGSKTSSSQLFLENVSPQIAVISVGRDNRWSLPAATILERLEGLDIEIYRTDLDRDVEVISDGEKIEVRR
ncbi:MAG TPA: MBL fold metallo-hydrolase [Candidatus Portnoybacteria bacterium]|nr:MBL fold metallo-hydrolase [Candidatus Portnoybacteria bacterium]